MHSLFAGQTDIVYTHTVSMYARTDAVNVKQMWNLGADKGRSDFTVTTATRKDS